jgi:hypothetical protein
LSTFTSRTSRIGGRRGRRCSGRCEFGFSFLLLKLHLCFELRQRVVATRFVARDFDLRQSQFLALGVDALSNVLDKLVLLYQCSLDFAFERFVLPFCKQGV